MMIPIIFEPPLQQQFTSLLIIDSDDSSSSTSKSSDTNNNKNSVSNSKHHTKHREILIRGQGRAVDLTAMLMLQQRDLLRGRFGLIHAAENESQEDACTMHREHDGELNRCFSRATSTEATRVKQRIKCLEANLSQNGYREW